ncbi:hypothetical protein IV203_033190 [Nitzschia inconspicua]|uniref:Uncharacterized protein n=1 Tax=Nitzschia inconspicua TaxID=303405 RepID=A0A9K3PI02_9STRA|nr:hypothetical protein IV203_033190 [Nitzschia inconspicua]
MPSSLTPSEPTPQSLGMPITPAPLRVAAPSTDTPEPAPPTFSSLTGPKARQRRRIWNRRSTQTYLGTPMADYEYMYIHQRYIPDDIFELYNLATLLDGDYVYVKIRRGMYGLPQAGRIANDYLRTFLEPAGYHPIPHTPGLWCHKTRPIAFSLVVDDFGVKYVNQDDVDHLLATL